MALFDVGKEKAYCTGFSWDEGMESERYTGNALFAASLKESYAEKRLKKFKAAQCVDVLRKWLRYLTAIALMCRHRKPLK